MGASTEVEGSTEEAAGDKFALVHQQLTTNLEMTNMTQWKFRNLSRRATAVLAPFAILAMWAASVAGPALAQQTSQQTAQQKFTSAANAAQSLFTAVQANNEPAIEQILGGPSDLTSSQDAGQDKADRELFVQKYEEMHRLGHDADGSVTLYIGAENWPFPIPLVAKEGTWRFDPETGSKEVMYRRIGDNELTAIAACREAALAAKNYHPNTGDTDVTESSPTSLAAKAATGVTGGDPVLFHGYYFRVLTARPGSFALIAYPAEYRSSGVMTFIVTDKNAVYEKDLGPNTTALASAMTAFRKDATWRVADE